MPVLFLILLCSWVMILVVAIIGATGVWRHVLGADGEKALLTITEASFWGLAILTGVLCIITLLTRL